MHVLVISVHPDIASLTRSTADEIVARLSERHAVEFADLHAEGFSPTFTMADVLAYRGGAVPEDVAAEQRRADAADAIVFVYPVFWWSFPAMLKGWVDRVFTGGFAWGSGDALSAKQIHLVGFGASSAQRYETSGHTTAITTTIHEGIFAYCGTAVTTSRILHNAEDASQEDVDRFQSAAADAVLEHLTSEGVDADTVDA